MVNTRTTRLYRELAEQSPTAQDRNDVHFCEVSSEDFLRFISVAARSAEVGPVGTQYEKRIEKDLLQGEPKIYLVGIRVEQRLVAAMSYGVHSLPRGAGLSMRIDLVMTRPNCRGKGLGSAVMAHSVLRVLDSYRKSFTHLSVIAQHPVVGHFVERLGCNRISAVSHPIYEAHLDDARRETWYRWCDAMVHRIIDALARDQTRWWESNDTRGLR